MARYIGYVKGQKGEASHLGSEKSGIHAGVQGWNVGVQIDGNPADKDGQDTFCVYATGGTNGKTADKLLAVVRADGINYAEKQVDLARVVLEWAGNNSLHADVSGWAFVRMAQAIMEGRR
jgi:hypothetical protein